MNGSSFGDIKSQIAEVKERVAGLGDALNALERFVDQLETAVGPLLQLFPQHAQSNGNVTQVSLPLVQSHTTTVRSSGLGAPILFKNRVKALLREVDGAIKPIAIRDAYINKGWPMEDEAKLYESIRTSLAMMKRSEEIGHNDEGYFLSK
jgi:hypothetical protein